MTEEIYSIENLEAIRREQLTIIEHNSLDWEAVVELLCADCLLCEEYVKDLGPAWKNYELCVEILRYGQKMVSDGRCLDLIYNVCVRAKEVLFDHPRLSYRLLTLQRDAQVEKGGELSSMVDANDELQRLDRNITAADQGRFEDIIAEGHLRQDPVEWTEDFENVIHLAQEKAYTELGDFPRGMGWCHSYWPALKRILRADYGIEWHSPAELNPRVIFD